MDRVEHVGYSPDMAVCSIMDRVEHVGDSPDMAVCSIMDRVEHVGDSPDMAVCSIMDRVEHVGDSPDMAVCSIMDRVEHVGDSPDMAVCSIMDRVEHVGDSPDMAVCSIMDRVEHVGDSPDMAVCSIMDRVEQVGDSPDVVWVVSGAVCSIMDRVEQVGDSPDVVWVVSGAVCSIMDRVEHVGDSPDVVWVVSGAVCSIMDRVEHVGDSPDMAVCSIMDRVEHVGDSPDMAVCSIMDRVEQVGDSPDVVWVVSGAVCSIMDRVEHVGDSPDVVWVVSGAVCSIMDMVEQVGDSPDVVWVVSGAVCSIMDRVEHVGDSPDVVWVVSGAVCSIMDRVEQVGDSPDMAVCSIMDRVEQVGDSPDMAVCSIMDRVEHVGDSPDMAVCSIMDRVEQVGDSPDVVWVVSGAVCSIMDRVEHVGDSPDVVWVVSGAVCSIMDRVEQVGDSPDVVWVVSGAVCSIMDRVEHVGDSPDVVWVVSGAVCSIMDRVEQVGDSPDVVWVVSGAVCSIMDRVEQVGDSPDVVWVVSGAVCSIMDRVEHVGDSPDVVWVVSGAVCSIMDRVEHVGDSPDVVWVVSGAVCSIMDRVEHVGDSPDVVWVVSGAVCSIMDRVEHVGDSPDVVWVVKFEVEDPEYEQSLVVPSSTVTAGLLRSFQNTPTQVALTTASTQSAADWTAGSSAIRTELRRIMDDKSLDSNAAAQNVHDVIDGLLRKNENLLAQNDTHGYKPHSKRGRPATGDGGGNSRHQRDPAFPASGQSVVFPAGQMTQGRVTGNRQNATESGSAAACNAQLGQLMRPKSPTRRCSIPERDRSHFSLALMESQVGCEEGERMFRVQEHEMVCAVSSQTKFLNKGGRLVSSVDISYYWCNFCNYSTTNKGFLLQHVMEHRFHCKHCRYQSFSRADVIQHSVHAHPAFQDTAAISQYCTLLSDYLRVHNPSEIHLDRKRKDPPQDDGDREGEPMTKIVKSAPKKETVQKSYSMDFDLFDVSVEEVKDREKEERAGVGSGGCVQDGGSKPSSASSSLTLLSSPATPGSQPMVSSLVGQPMTATITQPSSVLNGGHPVITQVFSASTLPPTLAPDVPPPLASSQPATPTVPASSSPSPTPTPAPPQYPNSVGAGGMQQMRSTLYWSCGYCSFTSTSQSGIKEHSVQQHSGKPHRYVALIKPEGGGRSLSPPPTTTTIPDPVSDGEVAMEGEKTPPPSLSQGECGDSSEEPPVLVKQEALEAGEEASTPIRVRFPKPRVQPKEASVLKCYYCDYSTRNLGPLRNHIVNRHRGKGLVGVGGGGASSRLFMCARTDCTFRSSSGHTFLAHAQHCTPWLGGGDPPDDDTFTIPLRKCLEATTRMAEEAQAEASSSTTTAVTGSSSSSSSSTSSSSQVSYDLFSCLYCKCQSTWSKKQTKRHVLQCHSSKCLVLRDVRAHRNRKRSCVFFCRWCPWEGTSKGVAKAHAAVCPPQPQEDDHNEGRPDLLLYGDHAPLSFLHSLGLDGFQHAGESRGKGADMNSANPENFQSQMKSADNDDDDDLGPPDITQDEDTVDRLSSVACRNPTADTSSTADANLRCKTFLSDGVPQLYISDPNAVDSEDSNETVQFDSSEFNEQLNLTQRKAQHKNYRGTSKENVLHLQSGSDVRKKVKPLQNKPLQCPLPTSKHRPAKKKMTEVQCFLCRSNTDTLRSLKLHMKERHGQHVSFSFRSLYHSSLHLKCRFFVCPMLDCTLYRYNEADVVTHYRQCHRRVPHAYLDPCYTPVPVKFQRRMNKRQADQVKKLRQADLVSPSGGGKCASVGGEGQYLCLYCDRYYYSHSLGRMKAHYLSLHPSMPIVVRDVIAFKSKKMSRVSVCEHLHCDFSTYMTRRLEEHAARLHDGQWEMVTGSQVMQCTACGWVTTQDSLVLTHLTTVHAGQTKATMVTLNTDDDPCL
ncbi:hypothetical protein ACOMHN_032594 [Nucella lapillus]